MFAAGCSKPEPAAEKAGEEAPGSGVVLSAAAAKNARVGQAKAGRGTLEPMLSFSGDLALLPGRRAKVPTVVSGVVLRVLVQQGDVVRKGQPLVVLQSRELGEAALKLLRAEHRLVVAKQALKREAALHGEGISSTEAYQARKHEQEHALLEVQTARARLGVLGMTPTGMRTLGKRAKERLARLTLRAPLSGKVVSVAAISGASVASGAELFEVADLSRLQVVFAVPTADLYAVRSKTPVQVQIGALRRAVSGEVTGVDPEVNTVSRTARARAVVDNPDGQLVPGVSVQVRLVADPVAARLTVPASAMHEVSGKQLVFVKVAGARYRPTVVTVGRADGKTVEILQGLRGGETVATENSLVLKTVYAK
jgi:cobalt-zinc-cadmium efflux system membrane fusion protein